MLHFTFELAVLKNKLEANEYLRDLLTQIDTGALPADLVCSGHGGWYNQLGQIDLSQFDRTAVYVYSGCGAGLVDELGVDIENEQYNPNDVVAEHRVSHTQEEDHNFPMLFGRGMRPQVPNFGLIYNKNRVPHPRVIEPMTGRVRHDMSSEPIGSNFFSLFSVLQRFPGRTIHWAACTGRYTDDGKMEGPFLEYRWTKRDPAIKRGLNDTQNLPSSANQNKRRRLDLEQEEPTSTSSIQAF